MKKIYALCFALTFGWGTSTLHAQTSAEDIVETADAADTDADAGKPTPLPYADLPEGMRQNPERLLNSWYARTYLRVLPDTAVDRQPALAPEVCADRLRRLPRLIAMPYNDIVRQYIDQYTTHQRSLVSLLLGAQNFYIPLIEEALEAEGLPLELKYLPIVESALDPSLTDRRGAAGLWRMPLATARRFELTVNSLIDERRDPVKSSQAAARHLKELYDRYGDWTTAIAAFTAGADNVDKAMRRAGGEQDYWKFRAHLPRESRADVPAFIATNYVMHHHCHHAIGSMATETPAETDTLIIDRELHLSQVAEACRLDPELLAEMNPQYRTGILPGHTQPCALRLPTAAVKTFLMLGDSVYHHPARQVQMRRHLAEPAPTAEEADESTEMRPSKKLSRKDPAESRKRKERKRNIPSTVVVRKGDNLFDIAKRNGTTVDQLRKINKIKGSNIRPGDKIRLK